VRAAGAAAAAAAAVTVVTVAAAAVAAAAAAAVAAAAVAAASSGRSAAAEGASWLPRQLSAAGRRRTASSDDRGPGCGLQHRGRAAQPGSPQATRLSGAAGAGGCAAAGAGAAGCRCRGRPRQRCAASALPCWACTAAGPGAGTGAAAPCRPGSPSVCPFSLSHHNFPPSFFQRCPPDWSLVPEPRNRGNASSSVPETVCNLHLSSYVLRTKALTLSCALTKQPLKWQAIAHTPSLGLLNFLCNRERCSCPSRRFVLTQRLSLPEHGSVDARTMLGAEPLIVTGGCGCGNCRAAAQL